MAIRAYDSFDQGEIPAMDARAANERIAEKAQRLQFLSRVPMVCECSDPACRTIVMIGLPEYRELRREPDRILTAPGHESDRAERHDRRDASESRSDICCGRRST